MSKRARIRAEEKIRIARECIAGKISQAEAEALTGVSKTVVADWIRLYVTEGASAFLPKRGKAKMKQSMSRVAKCIDNGPMEGFWGILKRERYYGRRFTSREQLVQMIGNYITYYNNRRVQRNLGVLTPMEKHHSYPLAA